MTKINLKSINKKILNLYCFFLKKNLEKKKLEIKQINIPTKTKKFSILKSPHVNKKAQEHFEIKTFQKSFYVSIDLNYFKKILINKPKQIKLTMRKII